MTWFSHYSWCPVFLGNVCICVCVYRMFLQLQVGAFLIMLVCARMCVYLHSRLYVCVGGARASHLRIIRCYILSGMPQRETEIKKRGGMDLKRWNRRGRSQQNSFWSIHLNVFFSFSPLHWQCDSIGSFLFTERWTTTTSAASPSPASTTCPNYEPCKSHLSHLNALYLSRGIC